MKIDLGNLSGSTDGIFYSVLDRYYRSFPYFIPNELIPHVEALEKNWEIIYEEFNNYHNKGLTKNDKSRNANKYYDPGFNTVTLITYMYKYYDRCIHFPETMKLLKSFPEVSTVSINVMNPGVSLKTHYGETNAIYRCHLGLKVPAKLPECGIRVGTEERYWEEGKTLAFVDANKHKAWNLSNGQRIIFLVDFFRPETVKYKWIICGRVWASFGILMLITRFPKLKKTPGFISKFAHSTIGLIMMFMLFLQRTLRFEVSIISKK